METLQLANEGRTEFISLIDGPIYLEGGFDFTTPDISGVFTHEPYGAQFDPTNFEPHTETFQVTMKGATDAVLHELDRLQNFLENVRLYGDNDIAIESSWLEWGARGEELKRSLLYSGTFQVVSRDDVTPGLSKCTILGVLTLTRHPLWEKKDSGSDYIAMSNQYNMGSIDLYTDIPGNTLARIRTFHIQPGDGTYTHYRFWVGIRRFNQGTSGFVAVWECEDSAAGTWDADTGLQADVGPIWGVNDASPGGVLGNDSLRTTFAADNTLIQRFAIQIDDVVAGDYDHFQGRYLVLLRCRVVGAGGVAGIQMGYGYQTDQRAEEVYVDNTNWRLIPLGNISIPPWRGTDYGTDVFTRYFTIRIYAEELTTCDLDCDALVLIPNEHLLQVEGYDVKFVAPAGDQEVRVDVREDDTEVSYGFTRLGDCDIAAEHTLVDWYLPPGDGLIVRAGEDDDIHELQGRLNMTPWYVPRWTLYRGA